MENMVNVTTRDSLPPSLRAEIPTLLGRRSRANSGKGSLEIIPPAPTGPLPPTPGTTSLRPLATRTSTSRSPTSRVFTTHENPSLYSIPETRIPNSLGTPRYNASKSRSLPPSPTKPTKPLNNTLPPLAPLAQPPEIDFSSRRIAWKGLPLEAAQWTYSSSELQEIVGRAIRLSAHESFIRLLPIEALDHSLVAESERLKTLKKATQAKYQFQVQRRTALLQALNSHNIFSLPTDTQRDAFVTIVSSLTSQVSEAAAACDQLTQELLRIADQQAQIAKAKDLHWASALAIALRKLNASYGRRTSELQTAQGRVEELEAELEDAWCEAEAVAKELDEMHAGISDDGTSMATNMVEETTEFAEIIRKSVANTAALREEGGTIASGRSADRLGSYSRVEAAKKRSVRVTNASLRQPRTRDLRRPLTAQLPHPTMPLPPIPTSPDGPQGESYLNLDSMGASSRKRPSSLGHEQASSLGHKRVVSDATPTRHQYATSTVVDRSRIPIVWMNADVPKAPEKQPELVKRLPSDLSGRSISEFSKLKLRIKRFSVPFGRSTTAPPVAVSRTSG